MENVLKRMELARTGSFGPDGAQITLQNLKDLTETFDGKCPVSLGHYMTKQDWWPSWGNIETIELVEDPDGINGVLQGDVSFHTLLAEAIDTGFYTGWSVSIPARASDNKRYLHHLAMLGSVPPKIRDLKVLATATVKPANAIDAKGEGMAFADQAFYSFSDFEEEGEGMNTEKDKKPEPAKTPEPTNKPEPVKQPGADFADQLKTREERAKAVYKDGVKAKVLGKIGSRWPAGKQEEVANFADLLVESNDYEFADQDGGKSLVDLFVSLIEGLAPLPAPAPGKMEFADPAHKQVEQVDRAKMAQKF